MLLFRMLPPIGVNQCGWESKLDTALLLPSHQSLRALLMCVVLGMDHLHGQNIVSLSRTSPVALAGRYCNAILYLYTHDTSIACIIHV